MAVLVSLCMIVKDEAAHIGRCLDSVQKIADEIIVVDTGSSDRTPEICLEKGAQVFAFSWTDDFSAARNFGLAHAAGDWILWLDADEELMVDQPAELLHSIRETDKMLLSIPMIHYYGENPPSAGRSYRSAGCRLFRSGFGIGFTGRIHEHLDLTVLGQLPQPETLEGVCIRHYGYLDEEVSRKKKSERNLNLLTQAGKDPAPWNSYHIASEFYRLRQYDKAYEQVNRAIKGFLEHGMMPPALAYKLKYEILLISCTDPAPILSGLEKVLLLYPDYVDLHFYRGVLLYLIGRYVPAQESFRQCLGLGENHPEYLILTGTGSHLAHYYLGLCAEGLGDTGLARAEFSQSLGQFPDFREAWEHLQNLKL